jgi:peptidyl-prolyl cis-trans isomerase C/foldase protein PrsA
MSDLDLAPRFRPTPGRKRSPVRTRTGLPILILFAATLAVALGPRPVLGAGHEIAARVNGDPVTRAQFDRMVANPLTLQQARRELGVEEPDRKELERLAMRKLVHLRLLVQEADRRKIRVTQKELDEAVTALRRRFGDLKEFGAWVKEQGLNDPELFETVRTDMLAERVTEALAEEVRVTEEEAQQYFEAHQDNLIVGAEVRLRIIAVSDKAEAEEIMAAVRKGVPFDRLARRRSMGRLAAKGGDTGWVDFQSLPSPLREAAVELKPGEVDGPLEKDTGEFLIVGLQDRRPVRAKSLSEARPAIERRLLPEKRREVIEAWLAEQEKKAKIEIFDHPVSLTNGEGTPKGGQGGS